MTVYLDLVIVLNFLIDFLLLLGVNRICGSVGSLGKQAAAAALGGVYGGICLLPGASFLGNMFWRILSFGAISLIAFGWKKAALRKGTLFALLTMTLGGVSQALQAEGILGLAISLMVLAGICFFGFSGRIQGGQKVKVLLKKEGKTIHLTALRDTGNTLKDLITGQRVLVVGSDIAKELFGFTESQLSSPVETMAGSGVCGLRLIPYRAVGCSAGMLLAVKLDEVWIDGERAGNLVAFAPQKIGSGETYQALTGGTMG